MAPPTPILTRDQIQEEKKRLLQGSRDCSLKSLTQYQCHISAPGNGEYICIPFKRVFEECIALQKVSKKATYKHSNTEKNASTVKAARPDVRRIEVTSKRTNA